MREVRVGQGTGLISGGEVHRLTGLLLLRTIHYQDLVFFLRMAKGSAMGIQTAVFCLELRYS